MILGSWPFSDEEGDGPLVLVADILISSSVGVGPSRTISVHVQRDVAGKTGAFVLTGGEKGHRLRFQLGFWELTVPAPSPSFQGHKRMNPPDEAVVAGILWDLSQHKRGYEIPREELLSFLSKESMRKLDIMVEVMGS